MHQYIDKVVKSMLDECRSDNMNELFDCKLWKGWKDGDSATAFARGKVCPCHFSSR